MHLWILLTLPLTYLQGWDIVQWWNIWGACTHPRCPLSNTNKTCPESNHFSAPPLPKAGPNHHRPNPTVITAYPSWSPSPSRLSVINTATRIVLWKHKADSITSQLNMLWWLSVSGQKPSTDPTGAPPHPVLGPYSLVSIPPTLLAVFQTAQSLGDIAWTSSSLFSLFPHKSIFQSLSPSVSITAHWVLLCPRQSSNPYPPHPDFILFYSFLWNTHQLPTWHNIHVFWLLSAH